MKILRSSILEAGIDDHQQVPKALGAQTAMNVRRGGNHNPAAKTKQDRRPSEPCRWVYVPLMVKQPKHQGDDRDHHQQNKDATG
jgi:hypothetical protein